MKKLTCILFTLLQVAGISWLSAQNSYSFSKTSGNPYSDLVNDNMVPGFNAQGLYNIPGLTGETFTFYNLPFTFGGLKTIAIGEYPFLRIDNDSSAVIIDVAFTGIDTIDASSRISYQITGTPGNLLLKTQYRNFKLQMGPAGNFINVQTWYYQQTGVVELHYGPRSTNNASGYNIQTGPNIGIFYAPDDFSFCYEKLWCLGLPSNMGLDSASNFQFKAMLGVPDPGMVYRFTPRAPQVSVALPEIKAKGGILSIFPNPANDRVILEGISNGGKALLYNSSGQCIRELTLLNQKTGEISTAGLPEGIYLLRAEWMDGAFSEKKLVICR
jgi:hypothetical protein